MRGPKSNPQAAREVVVQVVREKRPDEVELEAAQDALDAVLQCSEPGLNWVEYGQRVWAAVGRKRDALNATVARDIEIEEGIKCSS